MGHWIRGNNWLDREVEGAVWDVGEGVVSVEDGASGDGACHIIRQHHFKGNPMIVPEPYTYVCR